MVLLMTTYGLMSHNVHYVKLKTHRSLHPLGLCPLYAPRSRSKRPRSDNSRVSGGAGPSHPRVARGHDGNVRYRIGVGAGSRRYLWDWVIAALARPISERAGRQHRRAWRRDMKYCIPLTLVATLLPICLSR